MKTGEEIRLEEMRMQYSRQLDIWTELISKSQNLLKMNGLLLSIIVIGMGFVHDSFTIDQSLLLVISATFIVASIVMFAVPVIQGTNMDWTKIEADSNAEMTCKEKDTMLAWINAYNIAQEKVICQYNRHNLYFGMSVGAMIGGMGFLLVFIIKNVFFQ